MFTYRNVAVHAYGHNNCIRYRSIDDLIKNYELKLLHCIIIAISLNSYHILSVNNDMMNYCSWVSGFLRDSSSNILKLILNTMIINGNKLVLVIFLSRHRKYP